MANIWNKDDITISTIDKEDIEGIVDCFEKNGPVYFKYMDSPSPLNLKSDLYKMMNNSLDGTDNTNAILVIKRKGIIIGYMHMYVEYGITCLADIVINSDEQNDTRCSLTKTCISIAKSFASNDHRTLRIYRSYGSKNRILSEYWLGPMLKREGFTLTGDYMDYARFFEYEYNENEATVAGLPSLFPSIEEYSRRATEESQKRVDDFVRFMNSDIGERLAKSLNLQPNREGTGRDD